MARLRALHGFHAISARLRHHASSIKELYVDAGRHDARLRSLIKAAADSGVRSIPVDARRLDGLSGHAPHQGVVAMAEEIQMATSLDDVLEALPAGTAPLLLVLDGITDPHNLGACLRVADGAGVHAVIAPKDRAVGIGATVEKVASGAAETVPYITVTNLARALREMKERDIRVVGTSDDAPVSIYDIDLRGPMAWVLGTEGEGMRRLTRETCDDLALIPMHGAVESLNVSVASGVCLYETVRQRHMPVAKR
ncbi:MAG: 23S rRNA (guanosine(2251)-2'-O)-methyltransferase RlmB [Burkholderiaceae bacterium]